MNNCIESIKKCPLCKKTAFKTLLTPGHWIGYEVFKELEGKIGLVRCKNCQLIFINSRPSDEKLSAFYSGNTYSCHEATCSVSMKKKENYILKQITKHLDPKTPRTLLDYGAGGGGFLLHVRDCGWEVKGFEPGKRGLKHCKEKGLDVTDKLDDLASESFSVVTLNHVFEHLANPIEILNGIRRFLAPEGVLYIEVPNVRSLRAQLAIPFLSRRFPVDERYRAYPIHLMYYSNKTLGQMLEKAGWKVKKSMTTGLGLEEFIVRDEPPVSQLSSVKKASSLKKWRFRHILRDIFLSLGIGENLSVLAVPEK